MIKCILEFNNTIYVKNIYDDCLKNKNDKHKNLTIKELFIDTIDKKYSHEFYYNIHNNNYYFIKENKLIHPDTFIINTHTTRDTQTLYIKCYNKHYGGFIGGDIKGVVNSVLDNVIKPIIDPLKSISDVFVTIYHFFEWVGLFIYWFWFVIKWFFTDLLNPKNFVEDFLNSVKILIMTLFSTIFNIFFASMALAVNTVGGWMLGLWGWDQSSLTQSDKDSNYFKKMHKNRNRKCYLTNTNTIPFSIILGTILCPPIGVFMDMGLSGWFYILICILLTLLFYFPGLIYALLIIYS